jgi:hypothetical protein
MSVNMGAAIEKPRRLPGGQHIWPERCNADGDKSLPAASELQVRRKNFQIGSGRSPREITWRRPAKPVTSTGATAQQTPGH